MNLRFDPLLGRLAVTGDGPINVKQLLGQMEGIAKVHENATISSIVVRRGNSRRDVVCLLDKLQEAVELYEECLRQTVLSVGAGACPIQAASSLYLAAHSVCEAARPIAADHERWQME